MREFLEQALESVGRASGGLRLETFVVDNNSADGSAEMVRARFPSVRLIANEENVGFARANNQAIREARGRHLLILNPDTLVQEDTLRRLVRFMDRRPEAGAAGCRILNPDGSFAPESRRAFPTPATAFYRLTGLSRLFPRSRTFGRYNLTYLPKDEVCEVDALSGSCMMVRRAALYASRGQGGGVGEGGDGGGTATTPSPHTPTPPHPHPSAEGAGLLDEGFFMYGEDLDWCYRIQQVGWKIYYTPETQIIHYKGESTKKGELRYVRLFYGAMLRFVEKHFGGEGGGRPGLRVLALGLHAAIVLRAALSLAARVGGAVRAPLAEFALAAAAMAAGAWAWGAQTAGGLGPAYYAWVVPSYAAAALAGVALAGGYRAWRRHHLRPLLAGLAAATAGVAALSFFVKNIAFSRGALALGFASAALVLGAVRLAQRRRARSPRRTLVVGRADDAARLQRLVGLRPKPAVQLLGFVGDAAGGRDPAGGDGAPAPVPHLGRPRHLRDLVRLRGADEVVFAADSLSNTQILGLMRQLQDLPIHLKILASGRDRLIGKASVEDFSVPLVEAEAAVAPLRTAAERRAFEVPVALVGAALHPLTRLLARRRPAPRLRRLAAATARMPSVLAGRRALVGYDAAGPHPPPDWGLRPGVVSILDTLPERPMGIVEAHRAYWFYARNQSLALDAEIVLRALLK